MIDRIYVAATSQHVGKTTCTLGLIAAIRDQQIKVGYCKPVGQEFVDLGDLKADKDALLFSKVMNFELASHIHSPVIVGRGVTTAYLKEPELFTFKDSIQHASDALQSINDIVVYEGTGHPGVGSVIDLSNADVAHMLNAGVIMVVPGGIGNTIDELNANLALFREKGVPILGVIVNKVLPTKIEKVRKYVGKKLEQMRIPLLGLLPYDKYLANPIMETIQYAVNGKVLLNEHSLDNKVDQIVSGALVIKEGVEVDKDMLLVVDHARLDQAVQQLASQAEAQGMVRSPISGIVLHGEKDISPNTIDDLTSINYIRYHHIPIISTSLDTYGSAVKISHIEVKINTRTPWKADRAIEMVKEYVDLSLLLQ
ncbi:MAG: AAA family ATPase [Bacteroidota bacterium]